MNNKEFYIETEKIFSYIVEQIEDQDPDGEIELDLNDGIITLNTSKGTFVLNKQFFVKEIWLSSPISGPSHFVYRDNSWKSQNHLELFSVLTKELNINFQNIK